MFCMTVLADTAPPIKLQNELQNPEHIDPQVYRTYFLLPWSGNFTKGWINGNSGYSGDTTRQAEEEVTETIKRVVLVLEDDLKRAEIQEILGLKDRETFF